jgi:hypothetical protein
MGDSVWIENSFPKFVSDWENLKGKWRSFLPFLSRQCRIKAVQSFEQGWRNVPAHVERQALFLLAMKESQDGGKACWDMQDCPAEIRDKCPAWEFQSGHLCWFISGTVCHGEVQGNWESKMKICRKCEVFRSMLNF